MAKRSNGEGSYGWKTINGQKYYAITISLGVDSLTGKIKRKVIYGKTQKEAKEKLKEFQINSNISTDSSSLGDFYYNWIWNVKKQQLKPSTFEKWEGIYRNYIKPNKGLNNVKLINADTVYMQKITNELLKTHTLSQVQMVNACLKTCFNYAITINKITHNPIPGIIYPVNNEYKEEKNNYITENEQRALIKALRGDKLEVVILLGLLCGMRLGEVLALTPKDIDFKNKIININKSVKYVWTGERDKKTNKKIYEYKVFVPKTKNSIREVPLPNMLVPMIKETILNNKKNKLKYGELYMDLNIIFCRDNGEYLDDKQPNRHLKAALKRAKIEKNLHYHSLRHIFITNCISHDINIKTVMDWVGHSDISTTMGIYAEINKEKNNKEFNKINELFN